MWPDLTANYGRHCRYCDRELILRNGRRPITIFGPVPEIVEERQSELFDDDRRRTVTYVFCNEEHRKAFHSWDNDTSRWGA